MHCVYAFLEMTRTCRSESYMAFPRGVRLQEAQGGRSSRRAPASQHLHLLPGCAFAPSKAVKTLKTLTGACLVAQTFSGAAPGRCWRHADGRWGAQCTAVPASAITLSASHHAWPGWTCGWLTPAMHFRSYGVVLWEIITGDQPDRLRGLRMPECAL